MNKVYISLVFMFLCCCLLGQEGTLFQNGNKAYKSKDYQVAVENYLQLIEQGHSSAELYHNLGNAYFQTGQLGEAILFYEKAYRSKPSDSNIKKNLSIARDNIDSPVIEIPEFFIPRYWKAFSGIFSSLIWMIIQFVFASLFIYGVYLWRLKQAETDKVKGFAIALISVAMMLLSFFAGRTSHQQQHADDNAIVMTATQLMSAPDARSEQVEEISEGIKIKILDNIDDWYKVSLLNKNQGWVEKTQVEVI